MKPNHSPVPGPPAGPAPPRAQPTEWRARNFLSTHAAGSAAGGSSRSGSVRAAEPAAWGLKKVPSPPLRQLCTRRSRARRAPLAAKRPGPGVHVLPSPRIGLGVPSTYRYAGVLGRPGLRAGEITRWRATPGRPGLRAGGITRWRASPARRWLVKPGGFSRFSRKNPPAEGFSPSCVRFSRFFPAAGRFSRVFPRERRGFCRFSPIGAG